MLPSHDSKAELASCFNIYFNGKISDIRKSFPPYKRVAGKQGNFTGFFLEVFEPATEDEI